MTDDALGAITPSLDAPLIVVTTAEAGERAGCLVGFHTQSSIEPGRYCVWLSKANHTYRVALRSSHLAIHFLTSADLPLAELFGTRTGDSIDKFAGLRVSRGPGGTPVLGECAHWLVGRRIALLDEGGDHVCVITEPATAHPAARSSRSGCLRPTTSCPDMRARNVTIRPPSVAGRAHTEHARPGNLEASCSTSWPSRGRPSSCGTGLRSTWTMPPWSTAPGSSCGSWPRTRAAAASRPPS